MCPTEEIELPDGCYEWFTRTGLEKDAFMSAEWVKEFLAVCLGLALVVEIDHELLAIEHVGRIVFLGVVGDEDINESKTIWPVPLHNLDDIVKVLQRGIELLETGYKEFSSAWNMFLASVGVALAIILYEKRFGLGLIITYKVDFFIFWD